MAHPQPKRRVQLSNDAKHLHAFHFEGHESYHLEGDASFDTDKMKAKRELVKTSPKLRAAAMQFWTALGKGPEEGMRKDEYCFVHRRITKALAAELTEEEAAEAAEEDWEDDADDVDGTISCRQYVDGLISVADMWTDKVDELEYVLFVNKLFHRITKHAKLAAAAHSSATAAIVAAAASRRAGGLPRYLCGEASAAAPPPPPAAKAPSCAPRSPRRPPAATATTTAARATPSRRRRGRCAAARCGRWRRAPGASTCR